MVIMQIQTKDHAWQVLVKDEYLLIQKEYKPNIGKKIWDTQQNGGGNHFGLGPFQAKPFLMPLILSALLAINCSY